MPSTAALSRSSCEIGLAALCKIVVAAWSSKPADDVAATGAAGAGGADGTAAFGCSGAAEPMTPVSSPALKTTTTAATAEATRVEVRESSTGRVYGPRTTARRALRARLHAERVTDMRATVSRANTCGA